MANAANNADIETSKLARSKTKNPEVMAKHLQSKVNFQAQEFDPDRSHNCGDDCEKDRWNDDY